MKLSKTYCSLLRSDYLAYCMEANNEGCDMSNFDSLRWKPTRFHTYLCKEVQAFLEKETGNPYDILCISVPPQHGKTLTITETLPSWWLGKHPDYRVIEASYSSPFAKKFGKRNKEKIQRLGGLFGIKIASDSKSNDTWELSNHVGGMISRGILSGITGNPGDLIIVDDPIKNREEADSETRRNKIWYEWQNSILTRTGVKDGHGTKIIVIQTRWHEDDLYGRIAKQDPFTTVINLPLEAEENDLLGREPGESLCPEIGKDDTWLQKFKSSFLSGNIDEGGESGRRAWNALMQGHPTAAEGNLFKNEWWKYYSYSDLNKMRMDFMVISVDATFKDKDTSDYVAIECWGKSGRNMFLIDLVRERLGFVDTVNAISGMKAHYPQVSGIWIEDKANGSAIIDLMRREMPGIVGIEPQGGKVARANAVTSYIEAGNVFLPRDRNFTGEFIDECAEFPNGKHDDMLDAMTQCISRMGMMKFYRELPYKPKGIEANFHIRKNTPKVGIGEKLHVI